MTLSANNILDILNRNDLIHYRGNDANPNFTKRKQCRIIQKLNGVNNKQVENHMEITRRGGKNRWELKFSGTTLYYGADYPASN